MAINLQQIAPFECGTNPAEAWLTWKKDFRNYKLALKYHKEDEEVQIALFLQVCGLALKKTYDTFTFLPLLEGETRTLKEILEKFDQHFKPYHNLTQASYAFWNIRQGDKTFDQFQAALILQAQQCEFHCDHCKAHERNLKDRIIQGITDDALRERLLRESQISLEKVIEQCKSAELSKTHAAGMKMVMPTDTSIDAIKVIHQNSNVDRRRTFRDPRFRKPQYVNLSRSEGEKREQKQKTCNNCGFAHVQGRCPADNTTCDYCGKLNHWARVCYQRRKQPTEKYKQFDVLQNDSESEDTVYLGDLTLDDIHISMPEWYYTVNVDNHPVKFKLDSGSQVNVLPTPVFQSWVHKPVIHPTTVKVRVYTKQPVPFIGQCKLMCSARGVTMEVLFLVIDQPLQPVLGADVLEKLKLVNRLYMYTQDATRSDVPLDKQEFPQVCMMEGTPTVKKLGQGPQGRVHDERPSQQQQSVMETPHSIVDEFRDVFEGIGCLPGRYHIVLKEDAKPTIAAPRQIPQALESAVRHELQQMVQQQIIIKEEDPTDWVNNLLVVKRGDKIRLCLDPKSLNAAIKRPHYRIPSQSELLGKLRGSKMFSLFDAKKGFWHLCLDEESSKLTTFITPFGRYRFLRMPFGLNCAPEAFQMAIDKMFADRQDVNPYFDDIMLGDDTTTEHCKKIRYVLQTCRDNNLKLNKEKLQLAVPKAQFLGHVLTKEGVHVDGNKIQAIVDFPAPRDKSELQRFLGMATYLMQFVPNFSDLTHCLRGLLKKNSSFLWDSNMQLQFEKLKDGLVNAPVLQYFDPEVPILLSADASSYGLGAVLMQRDKPVAYASAALSSALCNILVLP